MAVTQPPVHSPTKTEKVMAIIIAVLSGIVASLVAYMIARHLGATALVGAGWSGGSFVAALGVVRGIEKELGIL
ncbi:hypothetical protein [Streptomyces sp. NPDC055056]